MCLMRFLCAIRPLAVLCSSLRQQVTWKTSFLFFWAHGLLLLFSFSANSLHCSVPSACLPRHRGLLAPPSALPCLASGFSHPRSFCLGTLLFLTSSKMPLGLRPLSVTCSFYTWASTMRPESLLAFSNTLRRRAKLCAHQSSCTSEVEPFGCQLSA